MILDVINIADQNLTLNDGFAIAIEFLRRPELAELSPGRQEIASEQVFAVVENLQGCNKEDVQLEDHERYIDIQVDLEGTDNMGWKSNSACNQRNEMKITEIESEFAVGLLKVSFHQINGLKVYIVRVSPGPDMSFEHSKSLDILFDAADITNIEFTEVYKDKLVGFSGTLIAVFGSFVGATKQYRKAIKNFRAEFQQSEAA